MNNDQREPLTEQQLAELWLNLPGDKGSSQFAWAFARAIERMHGIGVQAVAPTLPQSLLDLIGDYGMARTDGVSDVERLHRWQLLIDGIKAYALGVSASDGETRRTGIPKETTK